LGFNTSKNIDRDYLERMRNVVEPAIVDEIISEHEQRL
jgi:hypothetical protein